MTYSYFGRANFNLSYFQKVANNTSKLSKDGSGDNAVYNHPPQLQNPIPTEIRESPFLSTIKEILVAGSKVLFIPKMFKIKLLLFLTKIICFTKKTIFFTIL